MRQNTQAQAPKRLDLLRDKIRYKHYGIRTEQAYLDWVKRYSLFHGKRHPKVLGAVEMEHFLTRLAVKRNVSASTQNQARSALLLLYKEVLEIELPWLVRVCPAPRRSGVGLRRGIFTVRACA